MTGEKLETKAITAVIEELERQAAENPSKLRVRRVGDTISVDGEIDVDALVMVVVGSMAGGP
jgi:5-formyltetrahydrofolate cyclo-ligase